MRTKRTSHSGFRLGERERQHLGRVAGSVGLPVAAVPRRPIPKAARELGVGIAADQDKQPSQADDTGVSRYDVDRHGLARIHGQILETQQAEII